MVLEVRVRFRHAGCYSESLPPGVHITHLSGDATACLCAIRGPPGADLDALVARMERWFDASPRIVERGALSLVAVCHCGSRGITPRVSAAGVSILWPVIHAEGVERWHLLAPDRETLQRALDVLRAEGDVEVETVGNPSPDELGVTIQLGELARELSPRQLAVARLAIERGYYESPRRTSLAKLAEEFGLAPSTLQEHLQKAEKTLMARFGSVLVGHPALAASAQRGPGRPRKG